MSEHDAPPPRRRIAFMHSRDPHESHRAATPLELFFDLVFVVAIAQVAAGLHHGIAENHIPEALLGFTIMFFAIWLAWINATWFASAYDTDDVPYRLMTFVQMTGVLIVAAGIPGVFEHQDFTLGVLGYVVMRVAMVGQWLRAANGDKVHRPTALRYAVGTALIQVGWIAFLALPSTFLIPALIILALLELSLPIWAEQPGRTTWHPHHIAERYSLFTIIVLGESILSMLIALQTSLEGGELSGALIGVIVGGLLTVYSLWWLYFIYPSHDLLTSLPRAFVWGYGHLLIFMALAAVGAGAVLAVDVVTHHAEVDATIASLAITLPAAIFLVAQWALQERFRAKTPVDMWLLPLFAVLVLAITFLGSTMLLTGLLLAILVAIKVARG